MTYEQLVKAIEYFENEKLSSSGEKFENVSVALEAMSLVRMAFERSKEA